jgi:hypothetical protein
MRKCRTILVRFTGYISLANSTQNTRHRSQVQPTTGTTKPQPQPVVTLTKDDQLMVAWPASTKCQAQGIDRRCYTCMKQRLAAAIRPTQQRCMVMAAMKLVTLAMHSRPHQLYNISNSGSSCPSAILTADVWPCLGQPASQPASHQQTSRARHIAAMLHIYETSKQLPHSPTTKDVWPSHQPHAQPTRRTTQ